LLRGHPPTAIEPDPAPIARKDAETRTRQALLDRLLTHSASFTILLLARFWPLVEAFMSLRWPLTRKSRPPVATLDELADFLAAQTAYVSQRAVFEYCRARTGLNWDKLYREQTFVDSLEVCRWEAYAQVLAEVAELVLILLRRQDPADPQAYLPGLAAAAGAALRRHPVPGHRASWDAAAAAIAKHLAQSLLAPPRAVHLAGVGAADAIFAQLPIHPDLRREDREMFRNSVRFALCRVFDETTRRLDVAALAQALRNSPEPAGGQPLRTG
jgi:hypothetical protein